MEIKIGNNGDTKVIDTGEALYPSPGHIKKADLAEITFKTFLEIANELERLSKRLDKLESEI